MTCIVIVDDQGTNLKVLSKLAASLEPEVEVKAFADPFDALLYAQDHTPDLLITDFKMPKLNGAELIRRFRAVSGCSEVPTVVVTAYEDSRYRALALKAGATKFLLSPVNHSEFLLQSRKLLAIRRAEQIAGRSLYLRCELHIASVPEAAHVPGNYEMLNSLLETVSASLVKNIVELKRVDSELQLLLETNRVPSVFVDDKILVRQFTPQARKIFPLISNNLGKPLVEVECNLNYDTLAEDVRQVIQTGNTVDRYLKDRRKNVRHLLRIVKKPHDNAQADGAILMFTNLNAWQDSVEESRTIN